MGFPCSKSAPLEVCALIILSVSSRSVGINLSAMLIIITKTETGTPIFLSGDRSDSIPLVKTVGVVLKVRSDVPIIRSVILTAILTASHTPPSVMEKMPFSKITLPSSTKNKLRSAVNITRKSIGFNPLNINLIGMCETLMTIAVKAIITPYEYMLSTTKSMTM